MRIAPVLLAFFVAAACGGSTASNNQGAPSGATQPSSGSGGAAQAAGKAVVIHTTLTGGPTPGSWDVTGDAPCSSVHDQNGTSWGVEFSNTQATSTQLSNFSIGYMSQGANAGKFTVQAGVGDPSTTQLYVSTTLIQSETVGGSGTVALQDGGTTAKYDFDVKTKEGYGIKGTVQCNKLDRIG